MESLNFNEKKEKVIIYAQGLVPIILEKVGLISYKDKIKKLVNMKPLLLKTNGIKGNYWNFKAIKNKIKCRMMEWQYLC